MRLLRYRGLLVIVAWQTVPGPVASDSAGRIQSVFGFGGGQYEIVNTSCDGDVISTEAERFFGGGAQVDAWLSRKVRLTGFGGAISSDRADWDGGYIGATTALELQRFAIGAGLVRVPAEETWPSGFVRAGNRDALHVRGDLAPVRPLH